MTWQKYLLNLKNIFIKTKTKNIAKTVQKLTVSVPLQNDLSNPVIYIKYKKPRAETAAVASCQWWLTFPTPFQCGIFNQTCHQFFLTARKDTNESTVLLQDQLEQETRILNTKASCLHKNKLKTQSTETVQLQTNASCKAAMAEGHVHTD